MVLHACMAAIRKEGRCSFGCTSRWGNTISCDEINSCLWQHQRKHIIALAAAAATAAGVGVGVIGVVVVAINVAVVVVRHGQAVNYSCINSVSILNRYSPLHPSSGGPTKAMGPTIINIRRPLSLPLSHVSDAAVK